MWSTRRRLEGARSSGGAIIAPRGGDPVAKRKIPKRKGKPPAKPMGMPMGGKKGKPC